MLRLGHTFYVSLSTRTEAAGAMALANVVGAYGYTVKTLRLQGALHLKAAVAAVDDQTVVLNPAWVDPGAFARLMVIEADPGEPFGANVLRLPGRLVC